MKTKISKGLIFFFNNKKKLPNHFCESEVHSIILPFLLSYLNNLINHFKNNNGIKKDRKRIDIFLDDAKSPNHFSSSIRSSSRFCPPCTIPLSTMKYQPEVINQPTAALTQKTKRFPVSGNARGRRVISFYLADQYLTETVPLSSARSTNRAKTRDRT